MKKHYLIPLLLISAIVGLAPSCKKKDVDPLSQLPAATQTGANTFGCLVNGQAFTPHKNSIFNSPSLQCNYIYLNGGYNLTVGASNDSDPNNLISIQLGTTVLAISEGQILKLENYNTLGKAYGEQLLVSNLGKTNDFKTANAPTTNGELHITKFDQTNQILSGTFFFDAVNSTGDIVHVTDGRFDMKYTQ